MEQVRVLLVEKRESVAASLRGQLEQLGYRVVGVARNDREAVTAARALEPNLVLIESRLPALDGIEAARAILAQEPVPVVLLPTDPATDRAAQTGVLTERGSHDTRQLHDMIQTALERHAERRALGERADDPEARRRAITRATRILVTRLRLSEFSAFRLLRKQSRASGKSLWETAQAIVTADALVAGDAPLTSCLDVLVSTLSRAQERTTGSRSAEPAVSRPARAPLRPERLRVLLVGSKALVATRLRAQLEHLGHVVVRGPGDGREAVRATRAIQPDLVLMESWLPSLDGVAAARAITAERPVPIVLFTAYATASLVRRGREAGAVVCATPRNARELRGAIGAALERHVELQTLRSEVDDPDAARWDLEWAKRLLVTHFNVPESSAFRLIQKQSRARGTDIGRTARAIVEAERLVSRTGPLVSCLEVLISTVDRALREASDHHRRAGPVSAASRGSSPRPSAVEEDTRRAGLS